VNTTLFRPIGVRELELVLRSGARAFPPRLPEQPFFYPVLNVGYAEQIARDWNASDEFSGHAGFVTSFDLPAEYLDPFEVRVVGGREHQELWIPADQLPELNTRLTSRIRVLSAFYGPGYAGDAGPHVQELARTLAASPAELERMVSRDWERVLEHHGFWAASTEDELGLAPGSLSSVLRGLRTCWPHADLPLPTGRRVR
jgi:hypothetical protein